jgi:hypothetical protein
MAYRLYYDEDHEDRLKQLLEVSNPRQVIIKAIDYFKDPNIKVHLSTKKNKKYMILNHNTNKYISFGDIRYEDYTKHKDETKKAAYLARASNINGNWIFDKYSPNNLALHLLW